MSYVLEALKKREAEENPDAAVAFSLNTQQARRHRALAALLWAALVVNVVVLTGLVVWPRLVQEERAGNRFRPAVEPPALPAEERLQPTRDATTPRAMPAQPPPSAASAGGAAATPAQTPAMVLPARPRPAPSPVSLDELPGSVRERLPGIVFSTHIYAEDQDLRAVVANGQRLAEGDRLGKVTISEITETGVLLTFEDYLIAVPVVGFWETP